MKGVFQLLGLCLGWGFKGLRPMSVAIYFLALGTLLKTSSKSPALVCSNKCPYTCRGSTKRLGLSKGSLPPPKLQQLTSTPYTPGPCPSDPLKSLPTSLAVCSTVDSIKLEHGCRMIHAVLPFFFGLGLEDGHDPTVWLLL